MIYQRDTGLLGSSQRIRAGARSWCVRSTVGRVAPSTGPKLARLGRHSLIRRLRWAIELVAAWSSVGVHRDHPSDGALKLTGRRYGVAPLRSALRESPAPGLGVMPRTRYSEAACKHSSTNARIRAIRIIEATSAARTAWAAYDPGL